MVTGACVAIGFIHMRMGLRSKSGTAHLLFALTALVVAVYSLLEMLLPHAGSPARYLALLRWMDIVGGGALVASLTAFVWVFFGTGRKWLALVPPILMAAALIPDLFPVPKLVFLELSGLRSIPTLGGETFMTASGVRNPWNILFYLGVLSLLVFVVDSSVSLWRLGSRRRALLVGGAITIFLLIAGVHSALVDEGIVQTPYLFSFAYVFILGAMGMELSDEALRAAQLARDLGKVEQEANELRQEIAHVGRVSMLGQLASALAHEINQPLGAILRNTEAAELHMQNQSPDLEELRAILGDIQKDDQRAVAVIDRMRSLLGRRKLNREPILLRDPIEDLLNLVRSDATTRNVRLEMDVPADLPPVCADRVHFQQVLLNLIMNAMDAQNECAPEARRVAVSAQRDGRATVEVAVRDSGHGIPAGHLSKVFDSFHTTKPDGMGMGLAISRTIIEAHGGRLWAENNEDGGATFRFTLPIAEESSSA